jgi:hypothetical protein
VSQKIAADEGTTASVLKDIPDDAGYVEQLCLVTLSRPPTAAQKATRQKRTR